MTPAKRDGRLLRESVAPYARSPASSGVTKLSISLPTDSVACVHLVDETPNAVVGGIRVHLALAFAGWGAAHLTTTTATWSPMP